MKTARTLILRSMALCTVAALGACNRDTGSTPPPAAHAPRVSVPVAAKKGPGAAELTAGMVEAVNQGKSQLPVTIKFELRQRPVIGQPLDIDVAVLPQVDAVSGDLVVAGGEGLTVPPEATQLTLPAVEAGQVYREDIKATPTSEGVLLLNLTISLKHDDQTDSRAFSIPLIVER